MPNVISNATGSLYVYHCLNKKDNLYSHCNLEPYNPRCTRALSQDKMTQIVEHCIFNLDSEATPVSVVSGVYIPSTINISYISLEGKISEPVVVSKDPPYIISSNISWTFTLKGIKYFYPPSSDKIIIQLSRYSSADLDILYNTLHPLDYIFDLDNLLHPSVIISVILSVGLLSLTLFLCRKNLDVNMSQHNIFKLKFRKKKTKKSKSKVNQKDQILKPTELREFLSTK